MRTLLFLLSLFNGIALTLFAEQPYAKFSKDGQYHAVTINNSISGSTATIIQGKDLSWKLEVIGCRSLLFSSDSKRILYLKNGNLYIQVLGTNVSDSIRDVSSFEILSSLQNQQDVLVFYKKGISGWLHIQYPGQKAIKVEHVVKYRYLAKYDQFLLLTDNGNNRTLQFVDRNGGNNIFWAGTSEIVSCLEDTESLSVVFMTEKKLGEKYFCELFYYKNGLQKPKRLISDSSKLVGNNLRIAHSGTTVSREIVRNKMGIRDEIGSYSPIVFFANRNKVLFYLEEVSKGEQKGFGNSFVDVWTYYDPVFQTAQLAEKDWTRKYAYLIDVETSRMDRLEYEDELLNVNVNASDNWLILFKYPKGVLLRMDSDALNSELNIDVHVSTREFNWNSSIRPDVYLVSLIDGTRNLLREKVRPYAGELPFFWISPNGKYVVEFNGTDQQYYSYSIASHQWKQISKDIHVPLERGNLIYNHAVAAYIVLLGKYCGIQME